MSTAFTAIATIMADPTKDDYYNEIKNALGERRQALGGSWGAFDPSGSKSPGDDYGWMGAGNNQSWHGLQYYLGIVIPDYYDHALMSGAGYLDGKAKSSAVKYTAAIFETLTGLEADDTNPIWTIKFRRVSGSDWPADWTDFNDPAYSFGLIQAGDIIGPWIFEDMHNVLDLMWWTGDERDWSTLDTESIGDKSGVYTSSVSCADAKTNHASVFASDAWGSFAYAFYYAWGSGWSNSGPTSWKFDAERLRGKGGVNNSYLTTVDADVEIYAFMEAIGAPASWADVDSLGATQDTYHYFDKQTGVNSSPVVSDYLGNVSTSPIITGSLFPCPIGASYDQKAGIKADDVLFVFKWNFTSGTKPI